MRRSAFACERDSASEDDIASVVADFAGDLAEGIEHGLQRGADVERLARGDAAEDFDLADGGEAEIFELSFAGAGLNEDAAELGEGLDHEHARHEGGLGKMAAEKFFASFELPHCFGRDAGMEIGEFIDEAKLRTVREGGKRLN